MKKGIFLFLIALLLAAPTVEARNLKAYFTYCTFDAPGSGPFVETYLSVVGSTVTYQKNQDGKFQGSIEITLLFKQGEDIKNFKKYNLLSPELTDTLTGEFVNFIDQQRIMLPNGTYDFEIKIKDNNSNTAPFEFEQELTIDYPTDEMRLSDIELIESYAKSDGANILTKSGFDLVPYVSDFYPETMEKVSFYAEVYNSDKVLGTDGKYLVNYYIENYNTEKLLSRYRSFARHSAAPVNVLLSEFNIAELPSGNYNLVIELRDRTNELLSSKRLFFQRSNPNQAMDVADIAEVMVGNTFIDRITERDTIEEYIRSINPISTDMERNFARTQLKEAEMDMLKKFFLSFWMERNELDPEREWRKYQIELKKVDQAFGTAVKKGYSTDRGRVYLQYGPPNTRTERNQEPSSYPYEIWHYYKIKQFSNRRFVFYNPDLVTNDYELLHSDMFGEPNDYRWQARLNKRNTPMQDLDQVRPDDHFGGRSDDFYLNPR